MVCLKSKPLNYCAMHVSVADPGRVGSDDTAVGRDFGYMRGLVDVRTL